MPKVKLFDGKPFDKNKGFPSRKGVAARRRALMKQGFIVRESTGPVGDVILWTRPRMKFTRTFDGKRFGRYTSHGRKADALALAKSLREEVPGTPPAYRVRVVKSFGRWVVYRRQKKRKGFVR